MEGLAGGDATLLGGVEEESDQVGAAVGGAYHPPRYRVGFHTMIRRCYIPSSQADN